MKTPLQHFNEFDAKKPEIYQMFVRFTFQLINAGRKNSSSDMVLHRIRWETALSGKPDDHYKINNILSPYYARKFMAEHKQYDGFFRTRELISLTRENKKAA